MGRILYVGKSEDSVDARIKGHRTNGLHEQLGGWLVQCSDWRNIRIDVLIPPDLSEIRRWLQETEAACISRFNPLFNIRL
jgi:hypothetical protein